MHDVPGAGCRVEDDLGWRRTRSLFVAASRRSSIGRDRLPHSVTKPLLSLPGMAGNLSRRSLFPKMPLWADGPRRRIRTWYLCGCIQPGTRVKTGLVLPCAYSDLVPARLHSASLRAETGSVMPCAYPDLVPVRLYSARAPALRPVWFCLVRIRIERLCGAAYPD